MKKEEKIMDKEKVRELKVTINYSEGNLKYLDILFNKVRKLEEEYNYNCPLIQLNFDY